MLGPCEVLLDDSGALWSEGWRWLPLQSMRRWLAVRLLRENAWAGSVMFRGMRSREEWFRDGHVEAVSW